MKNKQRVREKLSGNLGISFSAMSLSLILLMALALLLIIISNGISVFWPKQLEKVTLKGNKVILGVFQKENINTDNEKELLYKIGNYDLNGLSYKWIKADDILKKESADHAFMIDRSEYGIFYGYFAVSPSQQKEQYLEFHNKKQYLEQFITKKKLFINQIKDFNLHVRELQAKKKRFKQNDSEFIELQNQEIQIQSEFNHVLAELRTLEEEIEQHKIKIRSVDGKLIDFPVAHALHLYYPNQFTFFEKIWFFFKSIFAFLSEEPRESNTEGGIFPAIFGTVSLVILMSIFVFPMGVLTAIYLNEYAKGGMFIRLIRISINNLAGVPSIVFGIFGLGFFVYGIGSSIDQLFFSDQLPTPTYGTGGILWASLTMALLTAPVVIVTTEEALSSLPGGIREASIALGATKWQTLSRIILPMSLPGMMTGFILAMARAAGEVAPLMITGVVKLAPSLPIDGNFPFVHFERKFMHLGFHIYDLGFQSPNVEAAKPIVFVTSLMLILLVLILSIGAIYLREKMKRKFKMQTF